ncbi:fructose-bisphosphatase class II [Escherichia coli]|nr:fructose-bisphosphatase class II [Escherichia coli]
MMSLAWPLFRVTEQAALAAWPQTGCGDKNKIDGLAVTTMRQALNVAFRGRVVIGEGNDILFSATGVTGGELVNGIQQTAGRVRTQTLLIGGADQTCNIIDSLH